MNRPAEDSDSHSDMWQPTGRDKAKGCHDATGALYTLKLIRRLGLGEGLTYFCGGAFRSSQNVGQ